MASMPYADFLNAVIDDGQEEVRSRFLRPHQQIRRDGALAGFEACRGLNPVEIANLLRQAAQDREEARRNDPARYWYWRERECQIEWVASVLASVSAQPEHAINVGITLRSHRKATEILGGSSP